jgi:uncharacterized repeat protein (TIGR02543 family)
VHAFALAASLFIVGVSQLFSYSSGPPNGYHGQSINCTSCHSGSALSTTSFITITGLPNNYEPNTSYPLTLSLSGSNSRGFGFQLAVKSGNSNVGSLATSQGGARVDSGYLEHTTRISSPISFNWTSPASSSGTVSFWVSSLATGGSSGTSGDQTYTFNKSVQQSASSYTLSLLAGTGGSVSGAGSFNLGTTTTIVATPSNGYDFTGWTGEGASNSSSPTTTVSMTQARSLTANFSIKAYNLSLAAGSGGSISGSGSFNHGTNPTIIATPDNGYDFIGWTGLGVTNSSSQSTTVSMTQARSLTANFSIKSYALSLASSSGGTVLGIGTFNHGTSTTIVANPDTGYDFVGWSGDGVNDSGSATTTVSMIQARSLTANFSIKNYTLSLSSGLGGSVSGDGSFNHGTNPTVVASSNPGYDFTGWTGQGVTNSNSATTTVSMTQARSLTANFSLRSYVLSLTASSGGSVSGAGSFNHGTTPTVVANPNVGYDFIGWTGAGTNSSSSATTTVSMNQARSLTANFSLKSYTLTLQTGNGGSVSGAGTFDHGQQATIQATAHSGFVFDSWAESGVSISSSPSTTIIMNGDKNLTASFTVQPPNTYSLILSSTPASAGTTSGAGSYAHNELIPVSATPNSGYQFSHWSGVGVTNPSIDSTTVSMGQDRNLTAHFSVKTYDLSITSGTGGATSESGTYDHGSNPIISATPSSGYQFINWSGAGVTDQNSSSTTVSMLQDRNLTANFSINTYALSINAGSGGVVSNPGTYNHGTNPTISATPDTGYQFTNWSGAGVTDENSSSTTVAMVQDRNLTAVFSLLSYNLTLNTTEGGSVTGGGNFNFGSTPFYSATAQDGYIFKNWTLGDHNFSHLSSGSFQITSNQTLTAQFEKSLDPALSNAQSLGNNVFSSWLGYFFTFDNGWYYHAKLGWIYPQGDSLDGLWFWSADAGWFWTNEDVFKDSFLWSKSDNDWVYLKEGSTVGDTLLYSYKEGGGWNYLPSVSQPD